MNKKLVLSVLSTAVLTSMAASAMAKPSQGFYVGGEVDKYYSPTALLADFKAGLKEILSNATDTVYVNKDGKAANFLVAAEAEKMEDVLKPATRDLFEENDYAVVGSEGEKWNPADEDDWPVPGDITVESVSANNLKAIAVKFSKAVDKDDAASTKVKLLDGTTSKSIKRELSEDGKTLYLVADTKFEQGKSYKVTIDKLKAAEGTATVSYETTVKTLDTQVPVAQSAALTSPKTLELQFSEPVEFPRTSGVLTDLVQIDGINVFASDVKQENDGKVTITLGNPVAVGNHKVKVSNLSDFAGLPIEEKEFDLTLAEDTTPPSVTGVEVVNANTIKVTFSEIVDETTVNANNQGLYVKVPGKPNNDVENVNKKSGTVYEMTLASPLDLAAVVEAEFAYKNIKDNYGNEVKEEKTFKFTAQDDVTSPTVATHTVTSSNNVEITFSKAVKNVDKTDFQLLDKDGKVVNGGIAGVKPKKVDNKDSDTVYVIELSDAANRSGVYSIKIVKDNDIVDLSIRGNKLGEATFAITLGDKKAPEIVSAKYQIEAADDNIISDGDKSDSKITIIFNEAMDVATLTSKANYLLDNKPLSDISGVTITASNDAKSVVITLDKTAGAPELFGNLKILAVKDVAGNTLKSEQLNQNLSSLTGIYGAYNPSVAFNDAIKEDDVQLVAKNKVKVFAEEGYLFAAVDPNKVAIYAANELEAQVTAVNIAADKKSVELTLNKELKANATNGSVAVQLKAEKDAFAFEGAVQTTAETSEDLVDKVKPTLVIPDNGKLQTDDDTDTITLEFDEEVTGVEADVKQALVIKNTDGKRIPTANYTINIGRDNTLEITFSGISIDGAVSVELLNNIAITDAIGNYANDFTSVSSDTFVVEAISDAAKALNAINSGTFVFTDLAKAGVKNADEAKFDAYKTAIAQAKDDKGADLTLADIQKVVDEVNTPEADPADEALKAINSGTYEFADLGKAGVKNAEEAKFDAYKTAIAKAKQDKGADLILADVQKVVDEVNTPQVDPADEALKAINSGTYEFADLGKAGVKNAEEAKFDAYKTAIAKAKQDKGADLILTDVQKVVDDVNTL
ncbi:Ig-like domain-containing protein [Brevibacillus sp. FSL L8-0520]|uniref:Ig-like domain-containing protein n=1 Tax=Brevibacillus sp. FSL L8-0520 TaxID=2954689 RepID=UPI0030D2DBB9